LIDAEEFQKIVAAYEQGFEVTPDQVAGLIDVIQRLDLQLLIAQNGLELSLANLTNVVPDLAERVLALAGRTDNKIKKKVAELAAGTVAQCEDSVQTYLVKATLEALKLLGVEPEDLIQDEEPVHVEEDTFVPHNHD
jgi:hypothetical protein